MSRFGRTFPFIHRRYTIDTYQPPVVPVPGYVRIYDSAVYQTGDSDVAVYAVSLTDRAVYQVEVTDSA